LTVEQRTVRAAVIATLAVVAIGGAAAAPAVAKLAAHGSVEQVYATGLAPGRPVSLISRRGAVVQRRRVDSLGGVVFRLVAPGRGYRVRQGRLRSGRLTVITARDAPPSTRVYRQRIPTSGYGYLTTRDGTKLAIDVRLPSGPGPYPTLVEYAGYGYANPAGPQSGISQIGTLLGFAVVDVNMRGTGCSGGSFDYFERLQDLDGYDVIETVARQPWALHHRVGMMGISYGGISQLFVAATDPPHLAAIAPLSVLDSSATTLYPGGILNTGFAVGWTMDRQHDALPASPHGGQLWALKRIQEGDVTCKHNQVLHGEAPNLLAKVRTNSHFVPGVANPIDPITFVNRIRVPSYVACQWTDEQTGGHCAALVQHFTGTRRRWFTFTNGVHGDSLDPLTFNRWFDFLELYVARRAPVLPPIAPAAAPTLYSALLGVPGISLPPDPIQSITSYGAARAAFQRLGSVRVLFDNGAGGRAPGQPFPAFEHSFPRLPIPGTQARSWYLGGGGSLTSGKAGAAGADRFTWSPRARPATNFTGPDDGTPPAGLWTATPTYNWTQNPAGTAAAYVTAPLVANTVVIGAGAAQLWVKASAPSVDLQVTVTEVRPDGTETFVQNGWLRANERRLDPVSSTLLEPVPTFKAADVRPLPRGRFAQVTVPLYYEGHVYRRGSRIRIVVSAPNGDQPVWAFSQTRPRGRATVQIAHSRRFASRLVLPVVPGVGVPTPLPPCPGLRGEPCRAYKPYVNRPVRLTG
jgi:predicted acyl esterase